MTLTRADLCHSMSLRKVVVIARRIGRLGGRTWGRAPRHTLEVEELRHIRGIAISRRQARQIEAGFDQLKDGCAVHHRVRYVVSFREW